MDLALTHFLSYKQLKINALQLTNYLFVLFAFVLPLHRDHGKFALIAMIVLWVFCLDLKKYYALFIEKKILIVLFSFFIYISASILWSEYQGIALKWVYFLFKYLFLSILIITSTLNRRYIESIYTAFLCAMFINMLATYYMYFFATENIYGLGFTEHNSYLDYSIFSALSIFLSLYRFLNEEETYSKVLYCLFIISMSANLFLSQGRTGQLAFLLTSCILIFIYCKHNIKNILSGLACLILLLSLSYSLSNTFQQRIDLAISNVSDVIKNENYNSSIGVRLSAFKILPELLEENNILYGSGIGDVRDIVHKKYMQTFGTGKIFDTIHGYLHNTFLCILVSLGVIGLIIYLYFLYCLLNLKLFDEKQNFIKYALVFTIVISSFSDNLLGQMSVLLLFSLFASILIVSSEESNDNAAKAPF